MILPGRGVGWREFFRSVWIEWNRNDLGNVAAALTFFSVLALFPFLLFLVSLAGAAIDPVVARGLLEELGRVAPREVTALIAERYEALLQSNWKALLTVTGLGAIWAAGGGVVALMDALNRAYGVRESRPWWKVRLIAFLSTLGAIILSVLAGLLAVIAPAVIARLGGILGEVAREALFWARLPVAGLLMMLVWALLYYFLPDVEQEFRFITPGSVVGVIIWTVISSGFSTYVNNFGTFDVTYGALGAVVVMLLWMWISSQVVLLGAEINALLEQRSRNGKRHGARRMADTGVSPLPAELEAAGAGSGPRPAPRPELPARGPTRPPRRRRDRLGVLAVMLGLGFLMGRRVARG